ncbi:MAG: aldehyde dehydrogenase, partial [Verrucomicrobia bacterium]|nr:aldehyde dehydrogenase [Verrucomicrobiota bacterium]
MKAGCRLPAKRFHKHIWPVQPKPLYLNGEFIAADKTLSVRNPATGETIAQMSTCGRDHVAQALADAHAAFQSWRNVVGRTRGDFLLKIAVEVERRKD